MRLWEYYFESPAGRRHTISIYSQFKNKHLEAINTLAQTENFPSLRDPVKLKHHVISFYWLDGLQLSMYLYSSFGRNLVDLNNVDTIYPVNNMEFKYSELRNGLQLTVYELPFIAKRMVESQGLIHDLANTEILPIVGRDGRYYSRSFRKCWVEYNGRAFLEKSKPDESVSKENILSQPLLSILEDHESRGLLTSHQKKMLERHRSYEEYARLMLPSRKAIMRLKKQQCTD